MGFEPENRLEQAMLLAASHEHARPEFFRLLMESELVVLGVLDEGMSIDTVVNNGKRYHPVFTSELRLNRFLAEPRPSFRMKGYVLFQSTRGASFVVNPGAECSKVLSPDEIAYWLDPPLRASATLVVAQPKVYPRKLVKALSVLFTSRRLIKAAHLAFVAREGIDDKAYPLIGLEADGDVPRLVNEIFKAAAEAMPGERIDVVYLDRDHPRDDLQKHLLGIAPFYKHTDTLN